MTTIFKYPIQITDTQDVLMPDGAIILTAQMQGLSLCLWAIVNPNNPVKEKHIEVFGTGHEMMDCDNRLYINTTQDRRGLVWHVFELVDI